MTRRAVAALVVLAVSLLGCSSSTSGGGGGSDCESLYSQFHRGESHDAWIQKCHDSDDAIKSALNGK